MKYRFLAHTGDIKFQSVGKTLDEVFENAALAVSKYLSRGSQIKSAKGKITDVSGGDLESLMYNFIDELIYLLDAEDFIIAKAKVTIRGFNLHAELFGDNASNYSGLDSIKAPTYSEMFIKKTKSGWQAQVVLDI